MDGEDTMDTPTEDMDTVYWENALLMLNLKLMPKQPLRQMPMPGMVDIMDTEDTEDTMDGADTMDTPTDMDIVTLENALLMPNPKLMPNPRLRLLPGTDTMVATTVIPITGAMDGDVDTMVVTGGSLSVTTSNHLV